MPSLVAETRYGRHVVMRKSRLAAPTTATRHQAEKRKTTAAENYHYGMCSSSEEMSYQVCIKTFFPHRAASPSCPAASHLDRSTRLPLPQPTATTRTHRFSSGRVPLMKPFNYRSRASSGSPVSCFGQARAVRESRPGSVHEAAPHGGWPATEHQTSERSLVPKRRRRGRPNDEHAL